MTAGESPDAELKVAGALLLDLWNRAEDGRCDEAEAVFEEMRARLGDADEPKLRERMARGYTIMANALGEADRPTDALRIFDEMLVRFGDDPSPAVGGWVADALD